MHKLIPMKATEGNLKVISDEKNSDKRWEK